MAKINFGAQLAENWKNVHKKIIFFESPLKIYSREILLKNSLDVKLTIEDDLRN